LGRDQSITGFNVDLACDLNCEKCEKFFDCELPQKKSDIFVGRMRQAKETLKDIKHKIIVVGGKGGVGKTLLTANFATALAMLGRKVAILDQVFDGPCIPKMMGVEGKGIQLDGDKLEPVEALLGIKIVSMGLILDEDEVVTWFGDMKRNATEEFLTSVNYGNRDYLVVDVPAGTSADTTNVLRYIPDLDGALIVTVPSDVSQAVAHKAAVLCKKAGIDVYGVVENLSGFTCPECGEKVDILQKGGGELLANKLGVPFLGHIPMDNRVAQCADKGVPFVYKYPDWEGSTMLHKVAKDIDTKLFGVTKADF
jgi:ATP-binding protein involved in chromosome partitioning